MTKKKKSSTTTKRPPVSAARTTTEGLEELEKEIDGCRADLGDAVQRYNDALEAAKATV